MHHIYTTKAIIIKSSSIGEANKYYFLLTEDLGFIRAVAQGVRLEKSKLKGHLQDFCQTKMSLVKGKNVWRITGVETLNSKCFLYEEEKLLSIKNIFSLLLRLLHGEEKNESLFLSVQSFLLFLSENNLSVNLIKNTEIITVLRILHCLGYFENRLKFAPFIKDFSFSEEILIDFDKYRGTVISDINDILKETHL